MHEAPVSAPDGLQRLPHAFAMAGWPGLIDAARGPEKPPHPDELLLIVHELAGTTQSLPLDVVSRRLFATGVLNHGRPLGPRLLIIKVQHIQATTDDAAQALETRMARSAIEAQKQDMENGASWGLGHDRLQRLRHAADVLVIAVGNEDTGRAHALHLFASADARKWAEQAMETGTDGPSPLFPLRRRLDPLPGRCHWWMVALNAATVKDTLLDAQADRLLDALLTANRPVARWRSSFFVPVPEQFDDEGGGATAFPGRQARNLLRLKTRGGDKIRLAPAFGALDPAKSVGRPERDYFLPHLGRLFGGPDGLRTWGIYKTRSDKELSKSWRVRVTQGDGKVAPVLEARITRVKMHRFFNDEGFHSVLEWELAGENDVATVLHQEELAEAGEGSLNEKSSRAQQVAENLLKPLMGCGEATSGWRWYLDGKPDQWSAAQLANFLAEARFWKRNYSRDTQQELIDPEGQVKSLLNNDQPGAAAEWLLALLELGRAAPLAGRLDPPPDDRAAVLNSIVLEGGPTGGAGMDMMKAALSGVDPWTGSYFYPEAVARDDLKNASYQRFADWGSHFMATNHSFCFLGFRATGTGSSAPSFSERFVHMVHMQTMYWRMFLLVLMQQQGLRDLERLANQHGDWSGKVTEILKLRATLARFVSTAWFRDVSTQLQGMEIYRHIRNRFQLDDGLKLLQEKVGELDSLVAAEADRRRNRGRNLLEVVALPGVILIALITVLGAGNAGDVTTARPLLCRATASFEPFSPFLLLLSISALLAAVSAWIMEGRKAGGLWPKSVWFVALLCFASFVAGVFAFVVPADTEAMASYCKPASITESVATVSTVTIPAETARIGTSGKAAE